MDHTTPMTPSPVARCGDDSTTRALHSRLFPPRDLDAEAHRRWVAASPWPEVVFTSAGAR